MEVCVWGHKCEAVIFHLMARPIKLQMWNILLPGFKLVAEHFEHALKYAKYVHPFYGAVQLQPALG